MPLKLIKASLIAFLWLMSIGTNSAQVMSHRLVRHDIEVLHPAISTTLPVRNTLFERQDETGNTTGFFMEVLSVECGDTQCRVDTVTLVWDRLGRYDRIHLPDGVELEKAEGKDFTPADYAKLDAVLSNPDFPLKDLVKQDLSTEGVHAVSGASVSMDKSAYVEGAIWTCQTLWHWAQGDSRQIIRNITGDQYSDPELRALILSDSTGMPEFALEQLIRREDFSEAALEEMLAGIYKDSTLLRPSMEYWDLAPDSIYLPAMIALLNTRGLEDRRICIHSITQRKPRLSTTMLEALPIPNLSMSYKEFSTYLDFLGRFRISSPAMTERLVELLQHEDFMVSRRVYWHLEDLQLSKTHRELVNEYYRTWEDKLWP
ncbi:hypothetical protein [Pontibacter sp. G13]|uniref:hypothetical protein n=1 Tax=Pontibacter sp. G13 TaxID=3074898 RepID=UPI00288B9FD6|nr:hypothetical protein [Pontibacter sp. G13]WNJ17950.1 hypothetical protein RJD25_24105 [Pontibacter sp. G13]